MNCGVLADDTFASQKTDLCLYGLRSGFRRCNLYLEVSRQASKVGGFKYAATADPKFGFGHGTGDVGMLNLVSLHTNLFDDILEREHSSHCGSPWPQSGGMKTPDSRRATNHSESVKIGRERRKTRVAEGSRRKVKES